MVARGFGDLVVVGVEVGLESGDAAAGTAEHALLKNGWDATLPPYSS